MSTSVELKCQNNEGVACVARKIHSCSLIPPATQANEGLKRVTDHRKTAGKMILLAEKRVISNQYWREL